MKKYCSHKLFIIIFLASIITATAGADASEIDSRRLGNTGRKLGVISINTSGLKQEHKQAFLYAISRGANFIDTSPFAEGSEAFVSENIGPSTKQKCMLSTRWKTNYANNSGDFIGLFQKSIKNLNTNFIDCVIIDEVSEVSQLQTNGMMDAFYKLKKDGKTKYIGVYIKDAHKDSMAKIVNNVLTNGNFDFIVIDYSVLNFRQMESLAEAVGRRGLGVIACGTIEESLKNTSLSQRIVARKKLAPETATIQWALSSTKWITSIIISPQDYEQTKLILDGAYEEED